MPRFTNQNTNFQYSAAELAHLNRLFEQRIAANPPSPSYSDIEVKSYLDYVAECVLDAPGVRA